MYGLDGAYVAGLLMGWASRLESCDKSKKDVIDDMNEFSKFLAERSGVTLFKKNAD